MKITDPYYIAVAYYGDWQTARWHRATLRGQRGRVARARDLAARVRARMVTEPEPTMSDRQVFAIADVLRSA